MNTERHENTEISAPANKKPAPAPMSSPLLTHARTRPRSPGGHRSPTIDVTGGPPVAVTTPRATRPANSTPKLAAAATTPIAMLQITMLTTSNVTRRIRSVSIPTGTVASPPTMLNAAASSPMSTLPTPNSCLIAGASAPSALRSAPSSASTIASAKITARCVRFGRAWLSDDGAWARLNIGNESDPPDLMLAGTRNGRSSIPRVE